MVSALAFPPGKQVYTFILIHPLVSFTFLRRLQAPAEL